jgi:hypothetical protein
MLLRLSGQGVFGDGVTAQPGLVIMYVRTHHATSMRFAAAKADLA